MDFHNHKFAKSDEEDFCNFFRIHFKSLCLYANSFVKDKNIAEDIVEEAFIKIWQVADMKRTEGELKSFLYTIVRNECLNMLRKQKTLAKNTAQHETLLKQETESYILNQMIAAETMREIHQAVASLPKGCRQVFVHLFDKGEKLQKVAENLNISINTVKSQRARGLQLIRQRLKITPSDPA